MIEFTLSRQLAAEAMGSCLLAATVVGSGIMAEAMADGNAALALLGNTLATGAILVVLIAVLGPVSGAHFNPAVSLVMAIRGAMSRQRLLPYMAAQVIGAAIGTLVAHAMFGLPLAQASSHPRSGLGQFFSEVVATFGLVCAILCCQRFRVGLLPIVVALFIMAGYWFTASTCFANPAVTLARSLTDSFAGIRPIDVPLFIIAEIVGALLALISCNWLLGNDVPIATSLSRTRGLSD